MIKFMKLQRSLLKEGEGFEKTLTNREIYV